LVQNGSFAFQPLFSPEREPSGKIHVFYPEHMLNKGPAMADQLHNPKLDEHPASNAEKDPKNWVSGDDPMTGAQASYLTTLCEEAGEELPAADLSKADASVRIDELKAKLGRE
jgi:hypothetical protein